MRSPANAFVTSSAAAASAADESPKIATTADSVVVIIIGLFPSSLDIHPNTNGYWKTGIQSSKLTSCIVTDISGFLV